jgi:hypothetical protein
MVSLWSNYLGFKQLIMNLIFGIYKTTNLI